ncbi:yemanuclein isoform X2 [Anopheles merus]|uniref:yemanuclein isoform X2 n=1 Tax=Anopheles merus TaxID=30066 RepID=UPI001BE4A920|nr:yemanuclein isoform X2 [Anopheles merus]XP_041766454.1 yemanuclein isoform X2 [Anopheles merus]
MSDVKRVTLTTISDVVKKGGTSPFGALSSAFEPSTAAAIHPFGSSKGGETTNSGPNAGSGGGGGGATAAKKLKTVRLELNLFEPTADSFPEFNFSKLIHVEQKRLKKAQKKQQHDDEANGFLSDPELDNDVARMARELERKYGSGSDYATKGKAARPSKLDYYDRGAGYDEEDSFIDNSEAYDELIPQEIETVGGGFYINSGQLEFKQLSNFERPEDAHRMPKPKKRALSTTSESSDEDEPAGEKKKAPAAESSASGVPGQSKQTVEKPAVTAGVLEPGRTQPDGVEKGSDAGKTGAGPEPEDKARTNGHVAKKQKIVDNGQVAAEQKSKSSANEGQGVGGGGKEKANGVKEKVAVAPGGVSSTAGGDEASKKDESGMKAIKTTTVKDMLRAKRDSLRKMEQEKKGRSSGSSRVSSSEAEEDGDGGGDDEDEDEENDEEDDEDDEEEEEEDDEYDEEGSEKNSPESGSEVDIASESESCHGSEKDARAGKSGDPLPVANGALDGGEGAAASEPAKERKQKERKLPEDIPDQLRRDVDALKELARGQSGAGGKLNLFESKVADLLLRIDDGARASGSGSSTRNAVFRHLEAQLSVSRQSLQLKLKKIRIRKLEGRTKSLASKLEDVIADTMPAIVTKYELNCLKVNELRLAAAQTVTNNPLPNGEKGDAPPNPVTQQIRNPKKKYTWNERSRDLLWELYNVRQQLFALVRPRNQSEDEVLAEFMRTKVVPLWPKGWIRYEDIQKELDRRKKALAKDQAAGATGGAPLPTGKKSTPVVSPLVSPSTTPFESAALPVPTPNGVKAHDAACPPRSSTPVKSSGTGKGGVDGDKSAATATHHSLSAAANMSPNAAHKRTSDHSIINIMNSPPPPPTADKQSAGDQRRSFDAMDTSGAPFANPDTGGTVGRDSLKRSPATPADRRNQLPDRQRWNSREDDSDSSIEIIAEYNVPRAPVGGGGGGGAASVPFQAGKLPASATVLQMTTPTLPGASNLPVLNKEKYKNLIAAKHKSSSHGGSGSSAGSSPIGMGGGVIGFAAPSGNVSGGGGGMHVPDMAGGTGAGSVRLKDTPSPIDVDVHQIMKDLKELQELQKQHNTSGNRKPDSSALQSQQQHVQQVPLAQFVPRS